MSESRQGPAPARLPVKGRLGGAAVSSLVAVLLMILSALAGLLFPDAVYPTETSRGFGLPTDLVNLFLGVPILVLSMGYTYRGKLAALLCWPGALAYVVYIYFIYAVGMPLSGRLLLNLALVPVGGSALLGLCLSIDAPAVRHRLAGHVPARVGGGILVTLAVLFVAVQLGDIANAIRSPAPADVLQLAPFYADVMVLLPLWLVGGFALWRNQPLGYTLGPGLLLVGSMLFVGVGFVMLFPLMTATSAVDVAGVVMMLVTGSVCFVPFFLFMRGAARNQ